MAKAAVLGDYQIDRARFAALGQCFKAFKQKDFLNLSDRERSHKVNLALSELIQKEKEPCFLLPAVLEFVEKIDQEKVLGHYSFSSFELWLNQHSGLSFEENRRVRARIAGKRLERSDYQPLFPIGMGKVYEGTHFVTAHKSPDLDTTVASFWGWLDAFAARVGDGLHIWNLPGGPPASQIEIDWMFRDLFGNAVFTHLAKTRTALSLTANDLMSQKGLLRVSPADSIASVDHERDHVSVVIVDKQGFYLGDWRSVDVEGGRQVVILLSTCLRWFENNLHLQLISFFAKSALKFKEIEPKLQSLFGMNIKDCEPAVEYTASQKRQVNDFLIRVLGIKEGAASSFDHLLIQLAALSNVPFDGVAHLMRSFKALFDSKGSLQEDRPGIFSFLEKAVRGLHEAIFKIRGRLERLDIALKTKSEVFGHHPTSITTRSEVEEIRSKMGSYPTLTVTYPDGGSLFPVGTIQSSDLRKSYLGTVSLRDFCNRDEMTIPSYLDVISVVDHHKSQLNTFSPPLAVIADVQSCNTLTAALAFEINDRVSLGGQSLKQIDEQIEKAPSSRLLLRLLKRRQAANEKSPSFIHPDREWTEYLHFLHAILDDTDLLSKVSAQDVECVASLLNRLKSLASQREVEIITLDDLPRDKDFPKKATARILQNDDMYSLYSKVYAFREKEVERNLELSAKGKPSTVFADTKEQNGCCRVGQTKLFTENVPFFFKHENAIRRVWLDNAMDVCKEKPEIDLHIHMISTIVSAEEVYKGKQKAYPHKDELWIWVPEEEAAIEHLKRFLSAFQASAGFKDNLPEAEFLGDNAKELSLIFTESFSTITHKITKSKLPIAVLRYKAGTLNSRKAMVSPFLPTLSS